MNPMSPQRHLLRPLPAVSLFLAILLAGAAAIAETIKVIPEQVDLVGPESFHQFLALQTQGKDSSAQLTGGFWSSSNPSTATVDSNGLVQPQGNGTTTITYHHETNSASALVTVRDFDVSHHWNFQNQIIPVLSKAGCNQGGCHGALAGKGGFRLSLRGYDPRSDHFSITREALGRRVEQANPARSLLLTKPTTAVRHKGGKRLDTNSLEYRMLAEWIAQGAPGPTDSDAHLKSLEVLPNRIFLGPEESHSLIVRAHYSDRVVDVTRWTRFSSVNETVASVDANTGKILGIGYGEGAIVASFGSEIALTRITSPFPNILSSNDFSHTPPRNLVDERVLQQLQELRLKPSPRASDEEFLRRVFLDTIGTLPTSEEALDFLTSQSPRKREYLIDRLLNRKEFVDYWSYRWSDLFLVNGQLLRPQAVQSYARWIRENVERNTPWDDLAQQVVLARGEAFENGAANFYALHQEPETMAENISQAFLGLSINCAKCHNHPLEKWTNDQYYSFANLFARVKAKGWGGDPRNGDGARTLYVEEKGDLIQPRTGKPQPPAPLDGTPIPINDPHDRRTFLADWLTSPDNPYFTRAIANRVWAALMGRGLVEPVDDLRRSNPASNEPLLDALSTYLISQNFDLKRLIQLILRSETYQRSSQSLPENKDDERYFSRYYPRRLMAEVLYDAINQVVAVPPDFKQMTLTDGSKENISLYPKGTRALELLDSAVDSYFLKTFGRNERSIVCECERSNQPSMVQVLHLANGNTLNDGLRNPKSRVYQLLNLTPALSPEELIEKAYLHCLARFPKPEESAPLQTLFNEATQEERREILEDLFWALLTSREFLFQH